MKGLPPLCPPIRLFSLNQESFHVSDLKTLLSPELVQMNRLPARATFTAFPNAESARTAAHEESPWFRSLDGVWQAHLARRLEEAFVFLKRREEERTWEPITVPGQWQMQGCWDRPHHTNIGMPFDLEPPSVPEENPTCVYRRSFRVPKGWRRRRIVLHFGAVDNTLLVYLNGRFIGPSEDSRCPAEDDITANVRHGADDELVAVVIKWSGTSWIEDQDHWWLSGLHREVLPELDRLKWFSNGPHESYAERKRGMLVGLYAGSVAGQYVPYIMPQSHGNTIDVRCFSLLDTDGNGLVFSGGQAFNFSASHFTADDLFRAVHTVELEARPEVFVTMGHLQRGLGTSSCGPDTLPKYRVPPGTYKFTFRPRPVSGAQPPVETP